MEPVPSKKRALTRKTKQSPSNEVASEFFSSNSVPNSSTDSIGGSARTKGKLKAKRVVEPPTRPKMIHTQRAKPADTENNNTRRKGRSAGTLVTTTSSTTIEERVRPRTKNVSYHDGSGRLPTATFPSSIKHEPEADIAADLRAIQDIDQSSPDDVSMVSSGHRTMKSEPIDDDNEDTPLNVKIEMDDMLSSSRDRSFSCEMCSESFGVREDLLAHVHTHI